MSRSTNKQSGFSLIELAIVLVIIGVILGSFVGTLSARIENSRRADTKTMMDDINQAIIGFAMINARLPCPATPSSSGIEAPNGGGACTQQHGFVPGRTLGVSGRYNLDNLLVDSWSNPIRYSITTANTNKFTTGIVTADLATLSPDLIICDEDTSDDVDCDAGTVTLTDTAPYILISLGKDGGEFVGSTVKSDSDQEENSGEAALSANASGENIQYLVGNDLVFVKKDYSTADSSAGFFDDILVWEAPYVLYSKMLEAGAL